MNETKARADVEALGYRLLHSLDETLDVIPPIQRSFARQPGPVGVCAEYENLKCLYFEVLFW